nr:G-type lectin S-receptor-like serine/threonine-protein kinase At4g27290 [Tanacetum cinerariifolium]
RLLELVDEFLGVSCNASEMTQSILIGMSCVQQRAEDRPSMSSVLFMLGGEGGISPPKQPGFFIEESESTSSTLSQASINHATITHIYAR